MNAPFNNEPDPDESKAIALQGLIDDFNIAWEVVAVGFPACTDLEALPSF